MSYRVEVRDELEYDDEREERRWHFRVFDDSGAELNPHTLLHYSTRTQAAAVGRKWAMNVEEGRKRERQTQERLARSRWQKS